MAKWVAAFILLMFATGSSFPIYFSDQVFRSLDQLDEALANGEISQEYYDGAVESLTGLYGFGRTSWSDIVPAVYNNVPLRPFPYWFYSARYSQKFESNYQSVRYDLLTFHARGYSATVNVEKRDGQAYLLRTITMRFKTSVWRLDIGRLNLEFANGITIGEPDLHTELHNSQDFAHSMFFPRLNRLNGIMVSRETTTFDVSAMSSQIEGKQYYLRDFGADIVKKFRKSGIGLVLLHQQVGEFGNRTIVCKYVAPYIRIGRIDPVLTVESSFQIGNASAHSFRYENLAGNGKQSYEFFSYAKHYQNLNSGGYAYADYEDATIDEIDLEYREKRAGRIGLALERTFHIKSNTFSGQIVRWDNRLENRECFASRIRVTRFSPSLILRRVSLQAIYQDFDIEHGTDTRKVVTLSTELGPSSSFIYENQHKIEQGVLNGAKKYPFRSRHDFTIKTNSQLESSAMVNYYDSDLNTSGNSQLTLAIGEKIFTGRDFRFSGRLQIRYKFSTEQLDNWELRINLEVVL